MAGWDSLSASEFSRIAKRKYWEVADEVRLAKGWSKARVAEQARIIFPEYEITNDQVYEWFGGAGDPRTSFTKIMEAVLEINLSPQCFWNCGKR